MTISPQLEVGEEDRESKRIKVEQEPILGFLETDKIGASQSHDDALVVTLQIGGFDIKRVMVEQESETKIMYPDQYKGLGLKPENLRKYDSPLVGFDRRTVTPMGMIKFPM